MDARTGPGSAFDLTRRQQRTGCPAELVAAAVMAFLIGAIGLFALVGVVFVLAEDPDAAVVLVGLGAAAIAAASLVGGVQVFRRRKRARIVLTVVGSVVAVLALFAAGALANSTGSEPCVPTVGQECHPPSPGDVQRIYVGWVLWGATTLVLYVSAIAMVVLVWLPRSSAWLRATGDAGTDGIGTEGAVAGSVLGATTLAATGVLHGVLASIWGMDHLGPVNAGLAVVVPLGCLAGAYLVLRGQAWGRELLAVLAVVAAVGSVSIVLGGSEYPARHPWLNEDLAVLFTALAVTVVLTALVTVVLCLRGLRSSSELRASRAAPGLRR